MCACRLRACVRANVCVMSDLAALMTRGGVSEPHGSVSRHERGGGSGSTPSGGRIVIFIAAHKIEEYLSTLSCC